MLIAVAEDFGRLTKVERLIKGVDGQV